MAVIRRILVVFAALVAAGAGLVVGTASPSYACSCAQVALGSLAKSADAVFVGTVEDARTEGGTRLYTLRVSDVYSGSPAPRTTVRTEVDPASCGMSLRMGRQYVVVGEQPKLHGDVTTTMCSGTRPVSDRALAAVERSLGPATAYRGAPGSDGGQQGESGTVGDGEQSSPANDSKQQESAAQAGDDGATAAGDEENTTAKVIMGAVLAIAIGAAFALPRLRHRNRRRGGTTNSE